MRETIYYFNAVKNVILGLRFQTVLSNLCHI